MDIYQKTREVFRGDTIALSLRIKGYTFESGDVVNAAFVRFVDSVTDGDATFATIVAAPTDSVDVDFSALQTSQFVPGKYTLEIEVVFDDETQTKTIQIPYIVKGDVISHG